MAHTKQMHLDPAHWYRWWTLHLRWWRDDAVLLLRRTASEFLDDHCTQLAASMSYYIFFSLFPLMILAVSILGLILQDADLRADVVDELLELLPESFGSVREDLESLIDPIASGRSALGLTAVIGLIWGASGMMSALRYSLDTAWDSEVRRPFVRGKLVDLALIGGVGLLLTLSISLTAVLHIARNVSDDVSDWLGPLGGSAPLAADFAIVLAPWALTTLTFAVLFKFATTIRVRWRDIWVGALVGAGLFEVLKYGFAVYLRNFSNYDAVYGSLGAVVALLFFVYLSSCVLLLGAEMAAEWPRVMHGHYDQELDSVTGGRRGPWYRRVLLAGLGLVTHRQPVPENTPDPEASARRAERRAEARAELRSEVSQNRPTPTPPDADQSPTPPPQ